MLIKYEKLIFACNFISGTNLRGCLKSNSKSIRNTTCSFIEWFDFNILYFLIVKIYFWDSP